MCSAPLRKLFLCSVFTILGVFSARADDAIRLGPGDVVTLSFANRSELSGDYRIDPEGNISLANIGGIAIAGRTIGEAADLVAKSMRQESGTDARSFGFSVREFRPVYISGLVRNAGSYPFQPGLRVAHIVAQAGGRRTGAGNLEPVAALEVGREIERIRSLEDELAAALINRERLSAEQRDSVEFTIPPEALDLTGQKRAEDLARSERAIAELRLELKSARKAVLASKKDVGQAEVGALAAQVDSLAEQSKLAGQELATLGKPADKGLVPQNRLLELRRTLANAQGERSAALALKSRAESGVVGIGGEERELDQTLRIETGFALLAVETQIGRLRESIGLLRAAVSDAGGGATMARDKCGTQIWRTTMTEGLVRIGADESTALQPGDLIRFEERDATGACLGVGATAQDAG